MTEPLFVLAFDAWRRDHIVDGHMSKDQGLLLVKRIETRSDDARNIIINAIKSANSSKSTELVEKVLDFACLRLLV